MSVEVFTQTAGQLITNALRDARIIAAEQSVQAIDLSNGLVAINMIIKHWQAQGLHLWSKREAILPLVTAQRKYLLGPDGDDVGVASTFFRTTLLSAIVATDTIIPVTTTTGLNQDGQSLTMAGAPDLLLSSPLISTQDWTTINSGTLLVVGGGLQLTNGAAVSGGAEFSLTTTPGITYQIDIGYTQGTSASADFTAEDTTGILATVNLTATGTTTLVFAARDLETTFRFENGSAVSGETSILAALNYRNKAAGDRIGIELDDGSRFWDNIVTVDSATQVTINSGVPSGGAAANSVYTYATAIARPLRLLQARFGESFIGSEIPVLQWSRDEYYDQPDKDSSGTVVNWYYTPTLDQGELLVWQVASNINQVLRFTYLDPINVPIDTADSLEFPSEWYMPLKWAIAAELGPGYGLNEQRQAILEAKALVKLEDVLGFDAERDSMAIQPDFD